MVTLPVPQPFWGWVAAHLWVPVHLLDTSDLGGHSSLRVTFWTEKP